MKTASQTAETAVRLREHRDDLAQLQSLFQRLMSGERFDRGRQEQELQETFADAIAKVDRALIAARGD